jgi:thiamine-phosphate pyrophosphorylase|tara:strand:- start:273 stop:908 length:636 start_codon:yes stop_codon:yes gene_type:complete
MDIKDIDFYFITDSTLTQNGVIEDVRAALDAGVKIVQYREKDKSVDVGEEARVLRELCRGKALFIVNDYVDLAKRVDADGVHIGQSDGDYLEAREKLGKDKIIGVTVHNVGEALEAQKVGADYLGVAPIYETITKSDAGYGIGLDVLANIRKAVDLPIVAVGGINLDNLEDVINHGADSVVAIGAVLRNGDVGSNIKRFIETIKQIKDGYK